MIRQKPVRAFYRAFKKRTEKLKELAFDVFLCSTTESSYGKGTSLLGWKMQSIFKPMVSQCWRPVFGGAKQT